MNNHIITIRYRGETCRAYVILIRPTHLHTFLLWQNDTFSFLSVCSCLHKLEPLPRWKNFHSHFSSISF